MGDAQTIQALQRLGFTEYEARAYTTLVREGEQNGYALAKKTGIPRANIYAVVQKLLDRGALLRVEQDGGQRYTAVPPERLLHGLESEHQRALAAAEGALAQQAKAHEPTAVYSLRGVELLAQARQLIDSCRAHLLIALQPSEATRLAEPLHAAQQRGVAITTLCLQACVSECAGCQGQIYRYAVAPHEASHWLVVVADDTIALVGQARGQDAEGMVSHQPLVIELADAFIRQNLVLAGLAQYLDPQLVEQIPPDALARLNDLYPDGGFPAYLRALGGHEA